MGKRFEQNFHKNTYYGQKAQEKKFCCIDHEGSAS